MTKKSPLIKPFEVTINKHEVKGWDMRLEVKTQLNVTHTPELTSELIRTHCNLTP